MATYLGIKTFDLKNYTLSFCDEEQETAKSVAPLSVYLDRILLRDESGAVVNPQDLVDRHDIDVFGPYVEYTCDTTTTRVKANFNRLIITLPNDSIIELKLTNKEIKMIQELLDSSKSIEIPLDHCKGPYAITIRYSWGDVEEAIDCKSFKKAWKKMKKLAMQEAEIVSTEHDCYVPLKIEYDKKSHIGIIRLHYTYDDTICIYEIVKTNNQKNLSNNV